MSIWRVFDELVSNSTLSQVMRDRIAAVAEALFHDRFEMDERAMLTAALTAANLEGYSACVTALLEFAETSGLDVNYLKGLIDAMADASEFSRNEQAIIKLATEVTRRSQPRKSTLHFVQQFYTPIEIEFLIILTSFVNLLARLQTVQDLQ